MEDQSKLSQVSPPSGQIRNLASEKFEEIRIEVFDVVN
jgi:hypothetical protein